MSKKRVLSWQVRKRHLAKTNMQKKEKDLCKIQSKIYAKIAVLNSKVQQHGEISVNSPPVSNPLNKGINFTVNPSARLSKPCTLPRKYAVHNSI